MPFVYQFTNKVNGKRYIGIAKDVKRRWAAHKDQSFNRGSATHFHNALRKYGAEAFELEVLFEVETAEDAKQTEKDLIATERPEYNMTEGGDGGWGCKWKPEQYLHVRRGWNHTDEAKAAIGAANSGKRPSEETRKKLREARSRRVTTEETRRKISEAQRQRYARKQQEESPSKMYDIGDDDLAKAYNPKNISKNARSPKLPEVGCNLECELLRVKKDRAPNAGNLYEFKFRVTKSDSESVLEGGVYTLAFFPGASDVKNAIFWEKITPLLMVLAGASNVLTFDAINQLGELMSLSKGEDDLGLAFRVSRVLEPCRADKNGVVKHKNEDGSPKIFSRDTFLAATASAV